MCIKEEMLWKRSFFNTTTHLPCLWAEDLPKSLEKSSRKRDTDGSTAQAGETKQKVNKWDFKKIKTFLTTKGINSKVKGQPTEWENIFTNKSDKGVISKNYKDLIKLTTKTNKQTNKHRTPLKNGQRT